MKQAILLVLSVSIMGFFLNSCKKSTVTAELPAVFTATIAGAAFNAKSVNANFSSPILEVEGIDGDAENNNIGLEIDNYQMGETGTFNSSETTTVRGTIFLNGSVQRRSAYTSIIINKATPTFVSGNFTFTCTDSTKVVGTFSSNVAIVKVP